jgi:hypothetical protein
MSPYRIWHYGLGTAVTFGSHLCNGLPSLNGSSYYPSFLSMCSNMVFVASIKPYWYSYVLFWCVPMIFLSLINILLFYCFVAPHAPLPRLSSPCSRDPRGHTSHTSTVRLLLIMWFKLKNPPLFIHSFQKGGFVFAGPCPSASENEQLINEDVHEIASSTTATKRKRDDELQRSAPKKHNR